MAGAVGNQVSAQGCQDALAIEYIVKVRVGKTSRQLSLSWQEPNTHDSKQLTAEYQAHATSKETSHEN